MEIKDAGERQNFYSHIPCGMWRQGVEHRRGSLSNFYSHIPCGMWLKIMYYIFITINFYSHIPCGMWLVSRFPSSGAEGFLLTHPVWDVTHCCKYMDAASTISTHTSRVGCDEFVEYSTFCDCISTHTSRVGCDRNPNGPLDKYLKISTHTSRVGCDAW